MEFAYFTADDVLQIKFPQIFVCGNSSKIIYMKKTTYFSAGLNTKPVSSK
jgi:hypothetical protein